MTREEAIEILESQKNEHYKEELNEALDMAISALSENKTQMIDKSNYDAEQYKTDLQSAYDCGYYKGKIDGIKECTAKLEKMNEELANCGADMRGET